MKRLTLIQSRSTEHVVDANSDDIFNYPWVYIEDAGAWNLSERQVARLREYLLRGGFLIVEAIRTATRSGRILFTACG